MVVLSLANGGTKTSPTGSSLLDLFNPHKILPILFESHPTDHLFDSFFTSTTCFIFGNDDAAEQLFEKEIKGRFNVNILGQAHWFLQMRIHHHADGCISFDQHRFLLNLLQRFCHDDAPTGKPKLQSRIDQLPAQIMHIYPKPTVIWIFAPVFA